MSPLRLGLPKKSEGCAALRLGVPEAELYLPSDYGSWRTGLSFPHSEAP